MIYHGAFSRCTPENHLFFWSSTDMSTPCPDGQKCCCELYTYGEYKKFNMHPADPRKFDLPKVINCPCCDEQLVVTENGTLIKKEWCGAI